MIEPRHSRQARLVEVGEAGQARIENAVARIASIGVRGMVAARYAAGAGVRALEVADAAVADAVHEVDARAVTAIVPSSRPPGSSPVSGDEPEWARGLDPAARAVAIGAYDALTVLRAALSERP